MGASKADLEDANYPKKMADKPVKLALCGQSNQAATRAMQRCLASDGVMVLYQVGGV